MHLCPVHLCAQCCASREEQGGIYLHLFARGKRFCRQRWRTWLRLSCSHNVLVPALQVYRRQRIPAQLRLTLRWREACSHSQGEQRQHQVRTAAGHAEKRCQSSLVHCGNSWVEGDNTGKHSQPVQRGGRRGREKPSGTKSCFQRRSVGMMEQKRKRRGPLFASQRYGSTDWLWCTPVHQKQHTHTFTERRTSESRRGKGGVQAERTSRVCTSHDRAGVTVNERQWRAAGEAEQAGTAAFPYIR